MSRRQRQGHFCWACNRILANERFSGRGHHRHICRECARLDQAELDYRQVVRDLERCFRLGVGISRKDRKFVRRHLGHSDLRIRAYAEELLTGVPVGDHLVELSQEEYEAFDDSRFASSVAHAALEKDLVNECVLADWGNSSSDSFAEGAWDGAVCEPW